MNRKKFTQECPETYWIPCQSARKEIKNQKLEIKKDQKFEYKYLHQRILVRRSSGLEAWLPHTIREIEIEETKRTISCVTFFGLKPRVSAADRCSVDPLPGTNCKTKQRVPGMKTRHTGGDPAEDEDDDSECDQYVDDFSH